MIRRIAILASMALLIPAGVLLGHASPALANGNPYYTVAGNGEGDGYLQGMGHGLQEEIGGSGESTSNWNWINQGGSCNGYTCWQLQCKSPFGLSSCSNLCIEPGASDARVFDESCSPGRTNPYELWMHIGNWIINYAWSVNNGCTSCAALQAAAMGDAEPVSIALWPGAARVNQWALI